MQTKTFEIRDRMTCIGAIGIRLSKADGPLVWRNGYGDTPCVLLTRLQGGIAKHDPYEWGDRTFAVAHKHIAENWDTIPNGGVVDVEFILGETTSPKQSEM